MGQMMLGTRVPSASTMMGEPVALATAGFCPGPSDWRAPPTWLPLLRLRWNRAPFCCPGLYTKLYLYLLEATQRN